MTHTGLSLARWMRLEKLWLADFRSYESAELALAPGLTAVLGDNGKGKSNLLEAVAWLATLESFRGAPAEALVRAGSDRAILRAEGRVAGATPGTADGGDGPTALIEAELVAGGRNRVQVNRQRLQRTRDLLGVLRVSVFTPDDLELVKGGPGRPAPVPRPDPRRPAPALRRRPRRRRAGAEATQRPAPPGAGRRSPRRRERGDDPRRVGREARRGG